MLVISTKSSADIQGRGVGQSGSVTKSQQRAPTAAKKPCHDSTSLWPLKAPCGSGAHRFQVVCSVSLSRLRFARCHLGVPCVSPVRRLCVALCVCVSLVCRAVSLACRPMSLACRAVSLVCCPASRALCPVSLVCRPVLLAYRHALLFAQRFWSPNCWLISLQ